MVNFAVAVFLLLSCVNVVDDGDDVVVVVDDDGDDYHWCLF